ncbi:MAG: hypothetical protein QW327_03235 [Candidatus Odinarchaeota archaeon]
MSKRTVLGFLTTAALLLSIVAVLPLSFQPVKAPPSVDSTVNVTFTVMPDGSVQITNSHVKLFNASYDRSFILFITNDTIVQNYTSTWYSSSTDQYLMKLVLDILNNKLNFTFNYDWSFNTTGSLALGDIDFNLNYDGNQGVLSVSALLKDMNLTKIMEEVFSMTMPFEIPSFTGSLNINKGVLTGVITISTNDYIGSPITVNLWLNDTNIRLYGNGGLIYQGESFNYTHLEFFKQFMESLVGTGEDSLYNITNMLVLCTYATFTYTNTTFSGTHPGALINFDFKAQNTTWGLRKVFMTPLIYDTIGVSDWNVTAAVMYEYEQMVANSVGSSSISYNPSTQKLTWSGSQTIDLKKVINTLMPPIEVGWWPPESEVPSTLYLNNSDLYEFFMEVFMASRLQKGAFSISVNAGATTGTGSIAASGELDFENLIEDYEDFLGEPPFFGDWWWNENVSIVEAHHVIEKGPDYKISNGWQKYTGGYQAIEYYVNNLNEYWLECYDESSGWWISDARFWSVMRPIDFNTTIKDLDLKFSNFYVNVEMVEGYGYTEQVTGVLITPTKSWVNSSWYNLNSLFEAEAGVYPSTANQKLGILVSGGSNGTHHTILSYAGTTPPDNIVYDSQGKAVAMFWDNKTIPDLKDLLFSTVTGDVTGGYVDPNYLPAVFNVPSLGVSLTINSISGATGLVISEAVGAPSPGGGFTPIGYYVNITATETVTSVDAWLTFYYTDEQVAGVDENSLNIYWFNPSTNAYEALSEVIHNTAENWISGHLTHFSVFVVFSFTPGIPLWIIIPIVVVVVAAGIGAYFVLKRRGIKGRVER